MDVIRHFVAVDDRMRLSPASFGGLSGTVLAGKPSDVSAADLAARA